MLLRCLMLATGGHPGDHKLAEALGHRVVPPVPSLFGLTLQAPALTACGGIAIDDVGLDLKLGNQRFANRRVLITHRGLGGPATCASQPLRPGLCIRAVTRRLKLDWCRAGSFGVDPAVAAMASRAGRRRTSGKPFEHLPRRYGLFDGCGGGERRWADLPIKAEHLVELLCAQSVSIRAWAR